MPGAFAPPSGCCRVFCTAANGPVMLVPKANRLATYRYLFNGAPRTQAACLLPHSPRTGFGSSCLFRRRSRAAARAGEFRRGSRSGGARPGPRGAAADRVGLPGAGLGLRTEGGANRRGASVPLRKSSQAPKPAFCFAERRGTRGGLGLHTDIEGGEPAGAS